jgi:sulfite reductase alpha subunit-like flavoprotein
VATVAIKGSTSSSSKSLFPNLNKGKHTFLMAKKSKKKVKSKSSSPKYVSSDDELDSSDKEDEDEEVLLNVMCKNPKERIKALLKEEGIRDEIIDHQEKLLVQEKESNQDLKELLKLEKEKMRSLTKNLRKVRRLSLVSRAQVVLFKIHMTSYKRLIKILKYNLMLFGQAPPGFQTTMKLPQVK